MYVKCMYVSLESKKEAQEEIAEGNSTCNFSSAL